MTVEVFEPLSGTHTTRYIAHLLPSLIHLRREQFISRIVVTTSVAHANSKEYIERLAQFADDVDFDTIAGNFHQPPGERVTAALLRSIDRNRPDFLVSTSANNGAFSLAMRCLYSSPFATRNLRSVGIIHNGFSTAPAKIGDRIRDGIHRFSRQHAPWSELHVVNPLLFERISRRWRGHSALRQIPDPIEILPPLDRSEARALLQIPVEGRYIGHVGQSDGRKAIPELLSAFRAANLAADDRLLIAGTLYQPYRELIAQQYGDLLATGRIVLLDRYLSNAEFHAANCSSDVVAVTYHTDELSTNLLVAIAAGRPVVASRRGYPGMIVDRFRTGWSCDIRNRADFSEALKRALSHSGTYRLSPMAEKLLHFHDPHNYASSVLNLLYRTVGAPVPDVKSWAWVSDTGTGGDAT